MKNRREEIKELLGILRQGRDAPGFREAYEQLYRSNYRHFVRALQYGKSYGGRFTVRIASQETAEDLVADFFYEFLQREKYLQLREDSVDAAAWFYRVFLNFVLDQLRHQKTDATFHSVADPDMEWLGTEEDLAEQTACRLALVKAYDRLDAEQKRLFQERLVEGRSFRQIQERMAKGGTRLEETSIRAQSLRMRRKLQEYLVRYGYGT
ncbi:MAG: sigma-70 family RNA polymerase sigma factor [Deltaproteobacteria bacterium]|nr:MAG: sigma-70 family RNA polymerase sigma factor [Deltaproteobacteria bacterium]